MINLSKETEDLAKRLADAQQLSVEEAVRLAIEDKAGVKGIAPKVRAAQISTGLLLKSRRCPFSIRALHERSWRI